MIKGKKIFITGGTGFIGTAICERLVQENQITTYDISREGRNSMDFSPIKNHPNLERVVGDVLDKEALTAALKDHNIIMHLAAIAGVSSYYNDSERTMKVNLFGTMNLLDAIRDNNLTPELLVDFSTSEVYGNMGHDSKEDQPPSLFVPTDGRGSYSIAKTASERLCFIFGESQKFSVLAVRPFNVYGAGQLGEGAVGSISKRAIKNEEIQITGDGTPLRAWCYIDDFLDGLLGLVENRHKFHAEIVNIGNPHEIETTYSLAQKIKKISGSSSPIKFIPHIGTEIQVRTPNITKIQRMVGYEPKIGIEEGLGRSIEWYRKIEEKV